MNGGVHDRRKFQAVFMLLIPKFDYRGPQNGAGIFS
jgi:hypothetical protein